MTAAEIAKALGGRKAGADWMARCPAHDDREPSLALTDAEDRVLVKCHAGCSQAAVMGALRGRGLWGRADRDAPVAAPPPRPRRAQTEDDAKRTDAALRIWREARPI